MPLAQQTMTINLHQLLIFMFAVELLFAIPAGLILKRLGLNMLWALLCFIPIAALFGLWLLAFVRWPRDSRP
jgi:hypothetical protein